MFEQGSVGLGGGGLGPQVEPELNAQLVGLGLKKVGELHAQGVEIGGLAVEFDAAGVTQEIFEDVAQALGFAQQAVDAAAGAAQALGDVGLPAGRGVSPFQVGEILLDQLDVEARGWRAGF